jgi:Concanavalin A-like lectin/glucanases superfamily/Glycosyl hydrolases family 2/Glycosyl hydrolases family 2, TIM barrel domain
VNGRPAGTHRGDYDSFSFDITGLLHRGKSNELLVSYVDPVGAAGEPVGKQVPGQPVGVHHTASSGIWQTVWLEPVLADHLSGLSLMPDLNAGRLRIEADTTGSPRAAVTAQAVAGGRVIASGGGRPGRPFSLRIRHPRLWTPSDPYLYGLQVTVAEGSRTVDRVASYFAMRSISLGRVGGVSRMLLNGRFLFEAGALDQGFWPDGVYTAPSDAALRFDIEAARRLGFNMLRKHVKVEPDRWYYWADRLGMMVWQDMPSTPILGAHAPTAATEHEFRRELAAIVTQLRSHPSIVMWVPFNEGWGQFDLDGITREIKRLDPTRLIDTQSGGANCCDALEAARSDVRDAHLYFGPYAVTPDRRASVIGEFGGLLPFPPRADRWPGVQMSIGNPSFNWPVADVVAFLKRQYANLTQEMRTPGVSASVYTELSAYEDELGILSYDRRVFTFDPNVMRALNSTLIAASRRVSSLAPQRRAHPGGLSGLWRFDETAGSAASDSSGFGHTLSLTGGAGWTRGVHGTALLITAPGQNAVASGPVLDTSQSFTVSAWLSPRQAGQSGTAVSQGGGHGSSFSLGIQTAPPGPQERAGARASGRPPPAQRTWWTFTVPANSTCESQTCGVRASIHYDDGRYSPPSGSWQYVTGVRDAATHTVSVYVDGVPQDVEQADSFVPSIGPLTIGSGLLDYQGSDAFIGAIDDVSTYRRALSPAEVWQLYQAERSR